MADHGRVCHRRRHHGWLSQCAGSPDNNPMLHLPASYHLVMGSFAFGTIFMATDPVSAAITAKRKVDLWYLHWRSRGINTVR